MCAELLISTVFCFTASSFSYYENKDLGSSFSYYENEDLGSSFSYYENEDRVLSLRSSFSRVFVFVIPGAPQVNQ